MSDFKVTNSAGHMSDLNVSQAKISKLTVDTSVVSTVSGLPELSGTPTNLPKGTLYIDISDSRRVKAAPTPES